MYVFQKILMIKKKEEIFSKKYYHYDRLKKKGKKRLYKRQFYCKLTLITRAERGMAYYVNVLLCLRRRTRT
ncbi:Uncharacterised protein [uncultured archaeon]|nr:Uncharacterised protein [uncultured archaeon]